MLDITCFFMTNLFFISFMRAWATERASSVWPCLPLPAFIFTDQVVLVHPFTYLYDCYLSCIRLLQGVDTRIGMPMLTHSLTYDVVTTMPTDRSLIHQIDQISKDHIHAEEPGRLTPLTVALSPYVIHVITVA
ncbi:hypothetical protein F5141DRAFT_743308 [Pisolithus sp. B1]|nr:hypothetical protein F5141DRAFT_743308 [Pisolithus sp. B1]